MAGDRPEKPEKKTRPTLRWVWVVSLVALAVLVTAAVSALGSPPAPMAIWAWEGPQQAVLDTAIEEDFETVFLYAPPGFSTDPSYALFIADATEAGVAVWALAGEPFWSNDSEPFEAWVDEATESGLFAGLAPDVEPWALPRWEDEDRQAEIIANYLEGLAAVSGRTHLPINAAVPFWFDGVDQLDGTTLIESVMQHVDAVTVLAYRDAAAGPDGIVDIARGELAYGAANDVAVMVAVETAEVSPTKITFAEEGRSAMFDELEVVEEAFAGEAAFAGLAVHDHVNFTAIPE